jgi:hypothetical protein
VDARHKAGHDGEVVHQFDQDPLLGREFSDVTEPCEDDWLTLLAIGAAAASLAAFAHEAAGHATGCLLIGGRVMLLTSINFRCQGATWVTDAAGPIGNLLPAVGALVLLRLRAAWSAPTVGR